MTLQEHAEDVSYDKDHIPALILSHTVSISLAYIVRWKTLFHKYTEVDQETPCL